MNDRSATYRIFYEFIHPTNDNNIRAIFPTDDAEYIEVASLIGLQRSTREITISATSWSPHSYMHSGAIFGAFQHGDDND